MTKFGQMSVYLKVIKINCTVAVTHLLRKSIFLSFKSLIRLEMCIYFACL